VAFASRSLAPTENKYAQFDKEALAIVYGVKKFHQYLFGRKFLIPSDHKPLQHFLSEDKSIPPMASSRIQCWVLALSAYNHHIWHRPGENHTNVGLLSRLDSISDINTPADMVLFMETLDDTPITARQIAMWRPGRILLCWSDDSVQHGWSCSGDSNLKAFYQRRAELSVLDGCILCGCRVVIPKIGHESVLNLLHERHHKLLRPKEFPEA